MLDKVIYSIHTMRRQKQRGILREAVAAVLTFHDRAVLVGNDCRAISLSRNGGRALVGEGLPPAIVEKTGDLVLVMREDTNLIVTLLRARGSRGRSYRRQDATRKSAA
jgi:hypothetical protein